jgi:hypothetical protein
MENINREKFIKYLFENRGKRLNKLKTTIMELSKMGIKQDLIWEDVDSLVKSKNSSNNAAQIIYEEKFNKVFDNLLEPVMGLPEAILDNFLKLQGCPTEEKDMAKSRLKMELRNEPLTTLLNDYLKIPIDLRNEKNNQPSLKKVPQYLQGWEDKDKKLFFDNLWKILEEIGFSDEEIGIAWRLEFP